MIYPDSIISTHWQDYRCQEIHFESQGKVYVIIGENLLKDITEFAYYKGYQAYSHYIRVEGFDRYEYYPEPVEQLVKHYIIETKHDIYTSGGDLVEQL